MVLLFSSDYSSNYSKFKVGLAFLGFLILLLLFYKLLELLNPPVPAPLLPEDILLFEGKLNDNLFLEVF